MKEPLYETWRPKDWGDVVGQERALKQLDVIRKRSGTLEGRAYFICGPSGSGKTTIAKLIAEEVAGKHGTIEHDAQRLNVQMLRDLDRMCWFRPLGSKGGHCFILNECHNLSGKIVSELQTVLESPHVQRTSTWIFTTTLKGQKKLFDDEKGQFDAVPFLSRCVKLELNGVKDVKLAFAMRAQQIAQAENLDGRPLSFYVALVERNDGNMRSVLQAVESGEALLETRAEADDALAAMLKGKAETGT